MPESPASRAERERHAVAAERRREAADLLRIVAATAEYGSKQLSNGLSPEQARAAAVECAGELAEAANALRRLARMDAAERRRLAVLWAGAGMSRVEIGRRLGISYRTARYYVQGRRSSTS